jgi:hypothetical protein
VNVSGSPSLTVAGSRRSINRGGATLSRSEKNMRVFVFEYEFDQKYLKNVAVIIPGYVE